MNVRTTPLVEAGYRILAAFTPYSAWRHFTELQRNPWRPAAELDALRWTKLRNVLRDARERCPFYRRVWTGAGIDVSSFTSFEDVARLPVVTKQDLLAAHAADGFGLNARADVEMTHTSGTTGPCLPLPFTREDLQVKYAAYLREFYATDWRLGVPSAAMHYCGHPEFAGRYVGRPDRDNFVLTRNLAFRVAHRRLLLTPYAHPVFRDDPVFDEWYRDLRRHRPFLLETMDFNLLALYRHIRARGLAPLRIPRIVVLASLAPVLRRRLEQFFDAEIFNRFGPHEVEGVGYACHEHDGLHMAVDCVHTEFLDEAGRPVPVGEPGFVTLTDLDLRAMPIIRYRIGDIGRRLDRACACGRSFPLMGDIEGRARDVFTGDGGRTVPAARIAAVVQAEPDVDLFQVTQHNDGRVRAHVAPLLSGSFAGVATRVREALQALLGASAAIEVVEGGRLELEANGKFCFARRGT
jgi:phenylacetate-CoA ligase